MAQGKQNMTAACQKEKAGIQAFSSPDKALTFHLTRSFSYGKSSTVIVQTKDLKLDCSLWGTRSIKCLGL